MKRTCDLSRLAHLLRACAHTTVMIATVGSASDMVRLFDLAQRVEAIADEIDDLDDDGDPIPELTKSLSRRRRQ